MTITESTESRHLRRIPLASRLAALLAAIMMVATLLADTGCSTDPASNDAAPSGEATSESEKDETHWIIDAWTSNSRTLTVSYDEGGNIIEARTEPYSVPVYLPDGQKMVDAAGVMTFSYDEKDCLIRVVTEYGKPLDESFSDYKIGTEEQAYVYDENGRCIEITQRTLSGGVGGTRTSYEYDDNGKLVSAEEYVFGGYEFDANDSYLNSQVEYAYENGVLTGATVTSIQSGGTSTTHQLTNPHPYFVAPNSNLILIPPRYNNAL